jgi:hypothetical protein
MAGEQTRLIVDHLLRRFMLDGILPAQAKTEQEKLKIFDSFHDFRSGTVRGRKDCCTPELNLLTNSDADGYLRYFGIPPTNVEEKTVDMYEKNCPLAVGFALKSGINFVDTVSFSQILTNPTCLTKNKSPAVKIIADIELDTVDKEKTIANALFTYLYGEPTGPTGVFFTFDASVNITKNFIINLNDTTSTGFYVGQILTPQNITDSATSPSSSGLFKRKTFNAAVPIIGEFIPPNKDRTKYILTLNECTSSFFSKDYATFKIEPTSEAKPYTKNTPYNFKYSITLPDKNGVKTPVVINFASDEGGKIGKDGPSVDYLKKIIKRGVPLPAIEADGNEAENGAGPAVETVNRCATIDALIQFVDAEYGEEATRKLIECIFDIKRAGDNEQANQLFHFISIIENRHKGVFQTLDQLSALYSRLLGNTTIYTYNTRSEKNLVCYKGTHIVDPLQIKKTILHSLIGNLNRILGVYLYFVRVIENSDFLALVENLQLYSRYRRPDDLFIEYLIKIRAADAYLYLTKIKSITYGGGRNIAEIAEGIRQKLTAIYAMFGREGPRTNINIHIDIDTLNEAEIQRYIDTILPHIEEINNNLKEIESYTEKFQQNNIIFGENGEATSLDIVNKMFTIKKDGSVDIVISNKSLNFSRQSAFNVVRKFEAQSDKLKAEVEGDLLKFLNKCMLIDKYNKTEPFMRLINQIESEYVEDSTLYRVRLLENILVPFFEEQVRLINLQAGGASSKSRKYSETFYNTIDRTLKFVTEKLVTQDGRAHFSLTTPSDLKSNKLLQIAHENDRVDASEYLNNTNISDSLLQMRSIIIGYSNKRYYSEEDIVKLGGDKWIARTFIDLANEFENMYINLYTKQLHKEIREIIKKFYVHVFSPLIKKFNKMYSGASNDYMIKMKLFDRKDIAKMRLTLEVFGTELPSDLTYDARDIAKVFTHLIGAFKKLAHHRGRLNMGRSITQSNRKNTVSRHTQKQPNYSARNVQDTLDTILAKIKRPNSAATNKARKYTQHLKQNNSVRRSLRHSITT